jgi:hypothetical protein
MLGFLFKVTLSNRECEFMELVRRCVDIRVYRNITLKAIIFGYAKNLYRTLKLNFKITRLKQKCATSYYFDEMGNEVYLDEYYLMLTLAVL